MVRKVGGRVGNLDTLARTLCRDDANTTSNSIGLERGSNGMNKYRDPFHGGPEHCTDVSSSSARKRGLRGWNAHPQSSPVRVIVHDGKVMEPERFREIQSMTRGRATATRPNPEARTRGGDLRPTPLVESHVTASTGFWSGPQNIVHPENPKKPSARTNRPKPGSERSDGSTVPDALIATL